MTVQHNAHSVSHTCFLDAPDLPAVLRMARAAMGWSQAEFAVVAGVSVRTVKALELRQTDPKMSTLKRLSAVLQHHGIRLWRDGDLGEYQEQTTRMGELIQQALEAQGGSSATTTTRQP